MSLNVKHNSLPSNTGFVKPRPSSHFCTDHSWTSVCVCLVFFLPFFFFFFLLSGATPAAYGSSQARDRISECYSCQPIPWDTFIVSDLSSICDLHHSSRQHRIPNPLSEARDRTHDLMDTSWIRFCCDTNGNSSVYVFWEAYQRQKGPWLCLVLLTTVFLQLR